MLLFPEDAAWLAGLPAEEMTTVLHFPAPDERIGPIAVYGPLEAEYPFLVYFGGEPQSSRKSEKQIEDRHNFAVNLGVEKPWNVGTVAPAESPDVAVEAGLSQTGRERKEAVERLKVCDPCGVRRRRTELARAVEKSQAQGKNRRLEKSRGALSNERGDWADAALAPIPGSGYLKRRTQRRYRSGPCALSRPRVGNRGHEAGRLQEALIKAGYHQDPADSIYSASVAQAVKAFQTAETIGPDGIAGPSTMKELGLT
jgi:hypothetical protein